MTRRGWVLFAVVAILWGVPYPLIKIAVEDASPAFVAWSRVTVGAAQTRAFASNRWGILVLAGIASLALVGLALSLVERVLDRLRSCFVGNFFRFGYAELHTGDIGGALVENLAHECSQPRDVD